MVEEYQGVESMWKFDPKQAGNTGKKKIKKKPRDSPVTVFKKNY